TAGQVLSLAREMAPGVASVEPEEAELTLVRYARPAMGTVFEIVLPFGHAVPSTYLEEAFDQVEEIEGWMSIYRSDSEVSEVNARAAR
ncbi:MAG TPA: hypothetical protein PKD72_09660, partial [Gemmatales bacterium]|nr:hypothetical protein [Gemmatales bacterium]